MEMEPQEELVEDLKPVVRRIGRPFDRSLSDEEIAEILKDKPQLETVRRGFRDAFSNFPVFPNPKRSGGFFKLVVRRPFHRDIFKVIKTHTKLGDLGTLSSMPTSSRNREYADRANADPDEFAIFIHTYCADDEEDKERVFKNLQEIEYLLRQSFRLSWWSYKTSSEVDAARVQYGHF